MDRKNNSLFVAYLIFLVICLIYKVVCSFLPTLQFELWDRIIIGVTISSYFFTLSASSSMVSYYNLIFHHRLDESAHQIVDISNKYIKIQQDNSNQTDEERELKNALKDIKQYQLDSIINNKKNDKTRSAYFYDVLGFLVFLLCIVSQRVSGFFIKNQDIYTLCAFFLMLLTMFMKENYEQHIDRKANENEMMSYRIITLCELYEKERFERLLHREENKHE